MYAIRWKSYMHGNFVGERFVTNGEYGKLRKFKTKREAIAFLRDDLGAIPYYEAFPDMYRPVRKPSCWYMNVWGLFDNHFFIINADLLEG